MTIVFLSNILNHYVAPLLEELNQIEGCHAYFVETERLPESLRKGGFKEFRNPPYLIKAWDNSISYNKVEKMAIDADVLIVGTGFRNLLLKRLRQGKVTIEGTERPLKKGIINVLSPTILKNLLFYHLFFFNKPFYKLCLGDYAARDERRLLSFKNKCYRFGYYPRIPEYNIEKIIKSKSGEKVKIIWCARFIKWKHPEMAILLAEKLAKDGYDFELNMVGGGVLFSKIKNMIIEKDLSSYVHLLGNFPNEKVLELMKTHQIFLFTSDRNEGWGVVLNEAMGQGCCPVASDEIGAVPSLLKDRKNGRVFKSKSIDSLYECIRDLLNNPQHIRELSKNAYDTVNTTWNPVMAAKRLYELSKSLVENKDSMIIDGPCSKIY